MAKRTDPQAVHRRVWRVTASAPLGEFVDSGSAQATHATVVPHEPAHEGWLQSSFDLAIGLDVRDASESLTPEAFQALFGR